MVRVSSLRPKTPKTLQTTVDSLNHGDNKQIAIARSKRLWKKICLH